MAVVGGSDLGLLCGLLHGLVLGLRFGHSVCRSWLASDVVVDGFGCCGFLWLLGAILTVAVVLWWLVVDLGAFCCFWVVVVDLMLLGFGGCC